MVDAKKIFQLRCKKCLYSEFSSGLTTDLAHLREVNKSALCTGSRSFRCMKCGGTMVMKRIARNCDVQPDKREE